MLTYYYDATGICGFRYKDLILGAYTDYQYRKNIQGDIIGIYGSGRTLEVTYRYDAWGNLLSAEGNTTLISVNPFTYRGYYRDAETGWYYLNSRYYDPSVCRFLNADDIGYLDSGTLCGLNLYSYCDNNPVMGYDPDGHFDWDKLWRTLLVVLAAAVVIAAVAAITVASGGTLAPVLTAAVAGFIIGGGLSVISQRISTGDVDWLQVLTDAAIGAASGSFGGTALGLIGMSATGAFMGFGGSVASDFVAGNGIDWDAAVKSGVMGIIMGLAGGRGVQYGKTGGVKAALNARKGIKVRYKQGGYRHRTNYDFGMKSNFKRLTAERNMLSHAATMDVILGIPMSVKLAALQYGVIMN